MTIEANQIEGILDYSCEQFMMYGVRSISMDDLSSGLGMSKKTLYQHFDSKRDLVNRSLVRHIDLDKIALDEITNTATDAIDEMVQTAEHIVIVFRQIRPTLIYDLQKYYPKVWDKVVELHSIFIKKKIENNLIRGKKEEYYRQDADADIISKLYVAKSFSLVDEALFSLREYPRDELIHQHILYHLHGILSDRGRQHLLQFQLFKN